MSLKVPVLGRSIRVDEVRAQDGDGLALYEDGGAGIFIKDGGYCGLGLTATQALLHLYGANAHLRIQDDEDANSYFEIDDVSMEQVSLKKMSNTGPSTININPQPIDGMSIATAKVFRATNTTGAKKLLLYKGNGSGTIEGQISTGGGNSYFQIGGGNFGIGTTTPGNPLAVNRSADGVIVDFVSAEAVEGNVSITDTTTSYNAFMGSHYTQLKDGQEVQPVGAIVLATGEIIHCEANIKVPVMERYYETEKKTDIILEENEEPPAGVTVLERQKTVEGKGITKIESKEVGGIEKKEYFSYVELASQKADKRVYGVYHAKMSDDAKGQSFGEDNKPIHQIAALGLYKVRVTDTNGDISAGDYIQSSIRAGEGERQDDDVLHNYTVAKSIIDVNWNKVIEDPQLGYKWQLIPATLHSG